MYRLQLLLHFLKWFVNVDNMFPEKFIQRIQTQFSDSKELLDALVQPVITSVRRHPLKGANLAFADGEKITWCNEGYYLAERPVFTLDPLFHAGAYYVQESSSMFLQHVLNE